MKKQSIGGLCFSLSANFLANFSDKKENGMCGGERRRKKSKKFQYQKRGTTFGRGGMSCRRFHPRRNRDMKVARHFPNRFLLPFPSSSSRFSRHKRQFRSNTTQNTTFLLIFDTVDPFFASFCPHLVNFSFDSSFFYQFFLQHIRRFPTTIKNSINNGH
jgi:hypothetical protein